MTQDKHLVIEIMVTTTETQGHQICAKLDRLKLLAPEKADSQKVLSLLHF